MEGETLSSLPFLIVGGVVPPGPRLREAKTWATLINSVIARLRKSRGNPCLYESRQGSPEGK
jgi:hypothetical protein